MDTTLAARRTAGRLLVLVLGVIVVMPVIADAEEAEPTSPVIDFRDPQKLFTGMGFLAYPLILCSLITLTFGLERFIQLRRGRVIPSRFVKQFITQLSQHELPREQALMVCRANGSPIAEIFRTAVRHWGRPTVEIEQAVTETGLQQLSLLKRNLRALQGSANLATLLGLLGTVIGMIRAFNEVAASQEAIGQAEVLATGIAQALLTTAVGLTIAIPSMFLYTYFAGKIERLIFDMDLLATDVVDQISAETIATEVSNLMPPKVTPKYVS